LATLFMRLIGGELPARFVWRDDVCVGFLTITPLSPGHTLVVPREEVDDWPNLEPLLIAHLMSVAQAVGRAILRGFEPEKVGLMIAGLEIPHAHVHVRVWPYTSPLRSPSTTAPRSPPTPTGGCWTKQPGPSDGRSPTSASSSTSQARDDPAAPLITDRPDPSNA
jgi:diadenosine tetraphosphate (Ap4A) HIT family hydrolase